MSKSTHTLKITKGSTTYTCDLYTTTAEARSGLYPDYPLFRANVNGTNLYAPFTTTLDSATESTPLICPVFERNGDLTKYCVAQKSFFAINITTVANETITVTAGGSSWNTTGNHWLPYGTTWTATVAGATGWNAGTLSASSGTLTNANVNVTASAPSLKTYTLTVGSPAHETVVVKYKNRNSANTGYEAEKTLNEGQQATGVRHFSTWTATVTADTGWTAGSLSPGSASPSGGMTGSVTVTAGAATHKTFTLKHTAAGTGQTLVVKYKNYNGTSYGSEQNLASGSSVTVGHNTTWTASLTANAGYTKGTLSPGTSGTVTANTTISATAAKAITPTVTIKSASGNKQVYIDITYTNTSGKSTTASYVIFNAGTSKSYTIKYNTNIKIYTRTGNTRYNFKVGSGSYSGNYSYHQTYTSSNITSSTTITFTAVNISSGGGGGDS